VPFSGAGHEAADPTQAPFPLAPFPPAGISPAEFPGNPTAGRHSGSRHRSGSTRHGNGFATAALVFGILPTPVFGIGLGITGLVRSERNGRGKTRSVTGIVLGLVWAGLLAYVTPHLMKAVDPGCSSFKGTTMTAYDKVIGDLNADAAQSTLVPDIKTAIANLESAAAMSKSEAAKTALTNLAAQLSTVRAGAAKGTVTGSDITALNADGSAADTACGTL
jgi:hypothetical protein